MAKKSVTTALQGEHVDIPAASPIAGKVAVHRDTGRTLWATGGSLVVFVMAAALPISPLVLLVMLLRQSDTGPNGLTWLWITMGFITEAVAFLAAYGMVRSILEAEA